MVLLRPTYEEYADHTPQTDQIGHCPAHLVRNELHGRQLYPFAGKFIFFRRAWKRGSERRGSKARLRLLESHADDSVRTERAG